MNELCPKKEKTRPITYTGKVVYDYLQDMLQQIKEDKSIVFKGQLFEDRAFSPEHFSQLVTKYINIKGIASTVSKINSILETRVVVGAITNKLNCTFTMFHLSNNFGDKWKYKKETDIKLTGTLNVRALLGDGQFTNRETADIEV